MKILLYDLQPLSQIVSEIDPAKASNSIQIFHDPEDMDYMTFTEANQFKGLISSSILMPIEWIISSTVTNLHEEYFYDRVNHQRLRGGDISWYGWLVLRTALAFNGYLVTDDKLMITLCAERNVNRLSGYQFGILMNRFKKEIGIKSMKPKK